DGDLSFEAEDRAVDVRFFSEHTGVVDEIASWKVVGAVEDDVVVADDFERVVGRERAFVCRELDVRIQIVQMLNGSFELRSSNVLCIVKNLAMQITFVDAIEIDETDVTDTRRGDVNRGGTSGSAGADDEHRSFSEPALAFFAEFGQSDLARVAGEHATGVNARRSPESSCRRRGPCSAPSLPSSPCPCPSSIARRSRRRSRAGPTRAPPPAAPAACTSRAFPSRGALCRRARGDCPSCTARWSPGAA